MDQAITTPAPDTKAADPARAKSAQEPSTSAGAPVNSVEAAPEARHLIIDGHTVASLAFSKRRADEGLRVDVRAKDATGRTVAVRRDLDPETLARTVGKVNADTIAASKNRAGTLEGERLAARGPDELTRDSGEPGEVSRAERFAGIIETQAMGQGARDDSEESSMQRIDLRWSQFRAAHRQHERLNANTREDLAADAGAPTLAMWADLDARDYGNIRSPGLKELAAEAMADNTREASAYGAHLKERSPAIAAEVTALAASVAQRVADKEERKRAEALHMAADRPQRRDDRDDPHREGVGRAERLVAVGGAAAQTGNPEMDARAVRVQRTQALMVSLGERYLVKNNEYRFRGEPSRVAFVDRGGKLTTDLAAPSIARSMVDVAETKGWDSVRVRGDDGYRRQVWLEASLRDVKVVGFEPSREDRELLNRERQSRQHNQIERTAADATPKNGDDTARPGGRGNSRRQVLAVLRSALADQKVDARTTDEVLRAASVRMDRLEAAGRPLPQVRVYDRQAPREAPVRVQTPRDTRERQPRAR